MTCVFQCFLLAVEFMSVLVFVEGSPNVKNVDFTETLLLFSLQER